MSNQRIQYPTFKYLRMLNVSLFTFMKKPLKKKCRAGNLFDNSLDLTISETKYQRKDGISDEGLQHFQTAYPSEQDHQRRHLLLHIC